MCVSVRMNEGACVHQSNVGEPELALETGILGSLDVVVDSGDSSGSTAVPARRHDPAKDVDAVVADELARESSSFVRFMTMAAVVVPPIVLVLTMALAWGGWFHWVDLALLVGMYIVTGLGITIGYHRLLSHRAFRVPQWLERFFATCGALSCQHGPIDWVGLHRHHHLLVHHCQHFLDHHHRH